VFAILFIYKDIDITSLHDYDVYEMKTTIICGNMSVFLYYAVMHAKYGMTIGKMIGGCRVVMMDGTKITIAAAVKRAFFQEGVLLFVNLSSFMLKMIDVSIHTEMMLWYEIYWFVDLLFIVLDYDSNRAIHDALSNTMVVMKSYRVRPPYET
jgi:uncharacterized RDD family membrane protein YckC